MEQALTDANEQLETKTKLNSNLNLELESLRQERMRIQKELEARKAISKLRCGDSHDVELDQDTVLVDSFSTQHDMEDTSSVFLTSDFQLITSYFDCEAKQ